MGHKLAFYSNVTNGRNFFLKKLDINNIHWTFVSVNCLQNLQFPAQNAEGKMWSHKIIRTNIITENNWQLNSIQTVILISDVIKQIKRWPESQLSY
jgi:hypothetical protein